jgi:negative regulator of flagellin synthesis FlgM
MQVSNDQVFSAIRAYISQRVKDSRDSVSGSKPGKMTAGEADSMELSDKAKDISFALKAVQDSPDVREDLVIAIKQQIAAGTYSVSGEKIAEKIIGRASVDELV